MTKLRPTKAQPVRDREPILPPSVSESADQATASASSGARERLWLRRPGAALLAFAVATLLTACSKVTESEGEVVYKAYGDTWVYTKTEIKTRYWGLFSPHGLFGERHAYRERHLIRNSVGKTISIPDNLYALQRNGKLKKVPCCQYFSEKGDLYNFDDKLVFIFANDRKFISNCFIYPRGLPNNDFEPPEKQANVKAFAEFDPERNIFKIETFDAGDNYRPFEYRAATLRTGRERLDLTILEHYAFIYAKRKPFMCDTSASTPSTLPAEPQYNDNAYQRGATRKAKIAVTPEATHSFVDRLQTFAARKQFKVWQAGSVERGDVSLALEGERILTVAAGNNAGLWYVGFYRRMPTPQWGLPSEQSVNALLHEIRSELEGVPGVSFRY